MRLLESYNAPCFHRVSETYGEKFYEKAMPLEPIALPVENTTEHTS